MEEAVKASLKRYNDLMNVYNNILTKNNTLLNINQIYSLNATLKLPTSTLNSFKSLNESLNKFKHFLNYLLYLNIIISLLNILKRIIILIILLLQ